MIPTVVAIATRAGSGALICRWSNNTSAAIAIATDAAVLITCSPITIALAAFANLLQRQIKVPEPVLPSPPASASVPSASRADARHWLHLHPSGHGREAQLGQRAAMIPIVGCAGPSARGPRSARF
jgi:hypothetical protein